MFQFTREKAVLWCRVMPKFWQMKQAKMWFKKVCETEDDAAMIEHCMDEALAEFVRTIRAKAYQGGWADAKAKRKKISEFSACADTDDDYIGW